MAVQHNDQPQTLVHFTSGAGGEKNIETEIVKPGSASARFMQRMERHKQAMPCHQAIDLRKKIKGEFFEYDYQGITHYLNSSAIELFENLLPKYQHVYTQEIYKIVIAAALQLESKASAKKTARNQTDSSTSKISDSEFNEIQAAETFVKSPLTIIPFGYHRHQNEIRMLYISEVQVQAKQANHWFDAKTLNISVSGLKIKSLQNMGFKEQQQVSIKFAGLNKKFAKKYPVIDYKIVEISQQDNLQVYCMVRVDPQDNDSFNSDLSNFIQQNRKRYKIDLDDFIESIRARTFERIYSQNCEYPSVFIHRVDDEIRLKHILCNEHFDLSENNLMEVLSSIADRLEVPEWANTHTPQVRQQLVVNIYSFTQHDDNGISQLYSALDSSFSSAEEKQNFLQAANASGEFKGWQLIIEPCQLLHESVTSTFLSDLEEISIEDTERLQLELETVVATGKLINASHSMILETLSLNDSTQDEVQDSDIQLQQFIASQQHAIGLVKVAQQQQRNENRYYLTTAADLKIYGKEYHGYTLDFSPNGIKLQLDEPVFAEIRDGVDISFPGLQKKFKKEKLEKQHFRIAYISPDGMTLCLSRDRRFVLHEASIFFRRLIDSNMHKLTQCSGDAYMVIRSTLFEKLMARNLLSIPFFICFKDKALKAEYISVNEHPNPLLWNFWNQQNYDFDAIFSGAIWKKILRNCSSNNKNVNYSFESEIFLTKNHDDASWKVYLMEDFPSLQSLQKYMLKFKTQKYKKILHLSIRPSASYDQNLIIDELHEIRSNSQNQSDQFLEQLKSIKAVGELIDITAGYCK